MPSVYPPKGKKTDALIGSVVNGKYRIVSLVAAGGMGKIYQAEQIALGRSVALKVLHSANELDGADDAHFKKRFLREASILARLQHPNIVTVFDYGSIEGTETERYFISMEYLSGETLARRIADRVSLPVRDTVRIARQIARGLTEAHAHGVIHRDLKPSNVMLLPGRDGEEMVKIVDFGIVKIVGDDSQEKEDLTQEGAFIGSPKYMAPEQIARGGKVDPRTDVYSFGIILYQCLTGTVPFDGASSIQTLMAHLNQAPDPIRQRAPTAEVPDWLDELVMRCIEKGANERPQTMEAVARTLADAEVALNSSRLLATMNMRSSSPTLSSQDALPSGTSSVTGPALKHPSITTQATISSVRTPQDESERTRTSPGVQRETDNDKTESNRKRRSSLLVAIAASAVLLVVFALRSIPHAPPAEQAVPTPAASRFTIRIESTPSGADVREADRVLGATPLDLAIDNDAVRSAPRRFVLAKDGFAPYSVLQGPSSENVHVVAQLAPVPPIAVQPDASAAASPPVPPARHASGRSAATFPPLAPPSSSASHPPLDIRLSR